MEEIVDNGLERPRYRLFTTRAIGVGTFFGGPVAAGILMGLNFGRLGKIRERNHSLIIGTLSMFALLWMLISIPQEIANSIPNFVIPAIYTAIVAALAQKFQGEAIENHLASGGAKGSGWAVAGWSFMSLLLMFGMLFVLMPSLEPYEFEGEVLEYGEQPNYIYHSQGLDNETLEHFGAYLEDVGYFHPDFGGTAQIQADESNYRVFLPYAKEYWIRKDFLDEVRGIEMDLEQTVLKSSVTVILVDEDFSQVYREELK